MYFFIFEFPLFHTLCFSLFISVSSQKFHVFSILSFIFFIVEHFPLTLTLWEKKIISFLQSREFLVSPLRLHVFLCIMEWVCGGVVEICSVLLVHFFVCLFVCCWDVLLCLFSLLSNKSHSFSWTWHLELYFFLFFNYFYYLLPIDIAGYWFLAGVLYVCVSVSSFVLSSFL